MQITKALIIDEPWISKILNGEKVWEMRSKHTSHRGAFALIRKGSGQVVGVANLTGVSGPYDMAGLADTVHKHCVGSSLFTRPDYKWWYAWELSEIQPLPKSVPYAHKSGAVTWVQLDQAAIEGIQKQLEGIPVSAGDSLTQMTMERAKAVDKVEQSADAFKRMKNEPENRGNNSVNGKSDAMIEERGSATKELRIALTQGNINNAHFYIPRHTELFPESVWGGKNKHEAGEQVQWQFHGLESSVLSDIDGSKRILRNRSAVREFYRMHQPQAGDELRIQKSVDGYFNVVFNR
ncbi:ASCH domain-containing protein [Pseudomaricurvus sp. HS19]|uniref:ASCH domain-containing protein n=1 Tax=Pseudomaricurvus sp. HS19 TaxID=2692626 RepID=UPI001370B298|nr:ASCH domain-containing protein [Pseudomaricurvus sp. HS19]MYM64488.1 ASCH domain-containing protein [Pseudomaricurvus sp. HS19]